MKRRLPPLILIFVGAIAGAAGTVLTPHVPTSTRDVAAPTPVQTPKPQKQTRKSDRRAVRRGKQAADNAPRNWNGTWLNSDGFETVIISGSGNLFSASFHYQSGDRSGSGQWTNCKVRGHTAKCNWTATHDDSTKTGNRKGTLKMTLSGDTISGNYFEDDATFNWKPGYGPHIFDGSMGSGVIHSRNYRRQFIDTPDEYDRTPLMLAAARNDLPAAKRLLAQGANVNARNKDDYTALMYAAFYGNAEMVEFLLDKGADVNARHKSGLTALIEAAKQNRDAGDVIADYVGAVEALLKKGADVSAQDKNGWTALMYAEKYGYRNKEEIVGLLRNAGAKE